MKSMTKVMVVAMIPSRLRWSLHRPGMADSNNGSTVYIGEKSVNLTKAFNVTGGDNVVAETWSTTAVIKPQCDSGKIVPVTNRGP